jgi:alkaline phosphatase
VKLRRHLLALFLGFLTFSSLARADPPPAAPRNVILMIGDGMGLAQIAVARYQKGRLALEDMKCAGFSYTHSLRNFVTDSSAGATALGTGYLIANGQVGVHPDGTRIKTVLEYAEERGLWTAMVVTCRVTHATPASLATHVDSRNSEDDIAVQLAESRVEVILGGGWDKFLPVRSTRIHWDRSGPDGRGGSFLASGKELLSPKTALLAEKPLLWDAKPYGTRTDRRNLVGEMERRGYRFVRTSSELALASSGPPGKLLGLFHSGPMPKASEGRNPSLPAMSLAALKILSQSPQGFFLMIEGSQIDWGGHANDFDYVVNEAADFDNAVETVQRFLRDSGLERETLVLVTADHETGGLTLNVDSNLSMGVDPKWTTKSHTGIPVPVFSSGPCAELFSGIQTHEAIGRKVVECVAGRKLVFTYPLLRRY